jgi:4'-phosphopantetheinyl transferase EntD
MHGAQGRPCVTGLEVLDEILPPCVVAAEAFDDALEGTPFPEEEVLVSRAVDQRRREFTTVRACARLALAQLDIPPVPIVPNSRGDPAWPQGIVGSMTHCSGYRGSAVARASEVATLGIDAEQHAPLPSGVLDLISLSMEREMICRLGHLRPDVCWDRLLFSAKESVYKAWFPLEQRWLGFEDAVVTMDPATCSFTVRLRAPEGQAVRPALAALQGRWLIRYGLVLTAVAMQKGCNQ